MKSKDEKGACPRCGRKSEMPFHTCISKTPNQVRSSEIVKLRRRWKKRIEDLNNGRNWAVNDRACKEARANKAEGIHECIIEINYIRKYGRPGCK